MNLSKSVGSDLGFSVSDGLVEPGVYVKSLKRKLSCIWG